MESIMLVIKFGLFALMEVAVVGILLAAMAAGVYQIVRNQVEKGRVADELEPSPSPVSGR